MVSLETLDDVVFETEGAVSELLQTKHHIAKTADLSDSSVDLWKSIRVWAEGLAKGSISTDSIFFLITTAHTSAGTAARYLKSGDSRDVQKAFERLNATAESSTNKENKKAYSSYRSLTTEQKKSLLSAATIIDGVPLIANLDEEFKKILYYAVEEKFLDSYLQRLEGWWLRRVVNHLTARGLGPILSEELQSETADLREQFKLDNLPIDEEILLASVDASGYENRTFVNQLRLIQIGNPRILLGIRNYFRAFEQRSRWIGEDLLLVGELGKYETRLFEEWEILFQQMIDKLGGGATDEAMKVAAQTLYEWVETGEHRSIRPGVTEAFIPRGTYHIMADNQRVGWHAEFLKRLKLLLAPGGATP